ncbi:MAG: 50S ribosomal protein L3 [Patescibacteria group bacterium]|jgi:large subunit ribosomal protein L3
MKFILGKKIGMTQVFSASGDVVPVTRVEAGPCQIVQVKDGKKDNAVALQLGFGTPKSYLVSKPAAGHLKDLDAVKFLHDFGVESVDNIERGDFITADTFVIGDIVQVTGTSKGKGFAGVVKRHHFRGAPASHGHKHDLRAPGSIGAGGVQRVFKGMRMAGRMGNDQVTVKNLQIIGINIEKNELLIKGAVPGGRGGLIMISGAGELKINKKVAKKEEAVKEVELAAETK